MSKKCTWHVVRRHQCSDVVSVFVGGCKCLGWWCRCLGANARRSGAGARVLRRWCSAGAGTWRQVAGAGYTHIHTHTYVHTTTTATTTRIRTYVRTYVHTHIIIKKYVRTYARSLKSTYACFKHLRTYVRTYKGACPKSGLLPRIVQGLRTYVRTYVRIPKAGLSNAF